MKSALGGLRDQWTKGLSIDRVSSLYNHFHPRWLLELYTLIVHELVLLALIVIPWDLYLHLDIFKII